MCIISLSLLFPLKKKTVLPPINSPINAYTYSPTALHVLKLCRHNFEHASDENYAGIKVLSHVSVFWGRERVQAKYNTHFLSVTWT